MLGYRHAFHAGNHGDVLKHVVLSQTLTYLKYKQKPFVYIDTHAGAGRYDLMSVWSQKNCEFTNGISRLWKTADAPDSLQEYLKVIREINPDQDLRYYPGSPWVASRLMRDVDRACLFELHSNEFHLLQSVFSGHPQIKVYNKDGFSALKALLPPPERRALVLLDPSYEIKQDFRTLVTVLGDAYRRFSTGIYIVWYPLIRHSYLDRLQSDIASSGIANILQAELRISGDYSDRMTGSGVLVVNPPWTLKEHLEICLPYLVRHMADDGQGSYRLDMLVPQ